MRRRVLWTGIVVVSIGLVVAFVIWQGKDQSRTNQARAFALGIPCTPFNWNTVHAQDRGCNACHADHLAQDVNRLVVGREPPSPHSILATSYGIPMRVEECVKCHAALDECVVCGSKYFVDSIHSLHMHAVSFTERGGNCDSCHATTRDRKLVLYSDETRYDIVNGVALHHPTPAFTQ